MSEVRAMQEQLPGTAVEDACERPRLGIRRGQTPSPFIGEGWGGATVHDLRKSPVTMLVLLA